MVVSLHVDAGNQTGVFCKSSSVSPVAPATFQCVNSVCKGKESFKTKLKLCIMFFIVQIKISPFKLYGKV